MHNNYYNNWSIPAKEDPEEDLLFVKEHKYYWTPSDYLINPRLKERGLKPDNLVIVKELARFFYYKMVRDKNYIKDEYDSYLYNSTENENLENEEEKEEVLETTTLANEEEIYQKIAFYEKLWNTYIPGYTPLEKSINILSLLEKEQKDKGENDSKKLTSVENLSKVIKNLPEEKKFSDPELNELMKNRKELKDFTQQVPFLKKISLVDAFGKTFEISKTTIKKRVFNSEKFENKKMVEYSDLVNSPLYQRILPTFKVKLLTKDLVVNMPIESKESKQKIIVLVDFSGSMNSHYKQNWVLAILADRLAYCMREECEIFFSYFLTSYELGKDFKFVHIYNKKTAEDFFKNFNVSPNGGDTEVGVVIDRIRDEIETKKKLFNLNVDLSVEKPEILVINDGNDSVKIKDFTWKTNAITISQQNEELKSMCEKNKGAYIYLQ